MSLRNGRIDLSAGIGPAVRHPGARVPRMAGRAQGGPGVPGPLEIGRRQGRHPGRRTRQGRADREGRLGCRRHAGAEAAGGRGTARAGLARTSYLVQHVPAKHEVYTAITYDSRFLSPGDHALAAGRHGRRVDPREREADLSRSTCTRGSTPTRPANCSRRSAARAPVISPLARALVNLWDMFITSGMKMCEVNPWRITPDNRPAGLRLQGRLRRGQLQAPQPGARVAGVSGERLASSRRKWTAGTRSRYQGQAHVSDLGGSGVLPILFGGGASTIIVETLMQSGGDPMFLSDFGGNPPYERMRGTAVDLLQAQAGPGGRAADPRRQGQQHAHRRDVPGHRRRPGRARPAARRPSCR